MTVTQTLLSGFPHLQGGQQYRSLRFISDLFIRLSLDAVSENHFCGILEKIHMPKRIWMGQSLLITSVIVKHISYYILSKLYLNKNCISYPLKYVAFVSLNLLCFMQCQGHLYISNAASQFWLLRINWGNPHWPENKDKTRLKLAWVGNIAVTTGCITKNEPLCFLLYLDSYQS